MGGAVGVFGFRLLVHLGSRKEDFVTFLILQSRLRVAVPIRVKVLYVSCHRTALVGVIEYLRWTFENPGAYLFRCSQLAEVFVTVVDDRL